MFLRLFTLLSLLLLVACASEPIKQDSVKPKQAPAAQSSRDHGAVLFSDLLLAAAKNKDQRYGVLLGVFATRMEAEVQAKAYTGALENIGVSGVPMVTLEVKDESGRGYYVTLAGQYKELEPAYYLQKLITRAVPGQYNLSLVPKAYWVN